MGKHFTDRQRLDMVKNYKQSGLNLSEFSRQANISRSTLKDWVNAFTSLQGEFIKFKDIGSEPGSLMDKIEIASIKRDLIMKIWRNSRVKNNI